MDGGTVWNTNLASAVNRCKEIVDDDSEITIDIILCSSHELPSWNENTSSALNNWLRYDGIKKYHNGVADVVEFREAFPKVNYRYYIEPTGPVAGGLDILKVDNSTVTWPMQMLGRKDGKAIVDLGEGFMFEKMEEWSKNKEIKKEYPTVGQYFASFVKSITGEIKIQGDKEINEQEIKDII